MTTIQKPGRQRTIRRPWDRAGYWFLAPFLAINLTFGLYPLIYSVYLSFADSVGGERSWAGLKNYRLLLQDELFWGSVRNGAIIFVLYVPLMTIASLVLATTLGSGRVRGWKAFRLIFFVPFITNMIAAGFTFQLFFNERGGLVNSILGGLGLPEPSWYSDPWAARVAVAVLVFWAWVGYNMVIMLAGLETIPSDIFEAAKVDGASRRQVFWKITVPLMRPIITFSVVLSVLGSFNLYAELVALHSSTGGSGPLHSTATPMLEIYGQAFGNLRFEYASAQSYGYFVMIFAVTIVQIRRFGQQWETS